MRGGWWRRNVWGLVLSPLFALGLFALAIPDYLQQNHAKAPTEPVPVDATGQAKLDDTAVRIIEFGVVTRELEIKKLMAADAPPLPPTAKIWRAMLDVHVPVGGPKKSCSHIAVEDATGRTYEEGPNELQGFAAQAKYCFADDENQQGIYTSTSYFVLPADARPVAVRIDWGVLPRYVRLPLP